MICNYMKLDDKNHAKIENYSDASQISSWVEDSVKDILENSYMNGYSDNTFKSKNNIIYRW